jgi:alkylation response protein AidB-like acyl-CoA dehydrogenase
MGIAITEAHRELEGVANAFLESSGARAANRALLDAPDESMPSFWGDLANLGWLGLHLPEECGGSGYGLEELVVVVEALGRAVAPGPFVPTVAASAIIAAAGSDEQRQARLPGLADGSTTAAVGFGSAVRVDKGKASGVVPTVVGGALAQLFLLVVGDDVVLFDRDAAGVTINVPNNVDRARRAANVTLKGTPVQVLAGAGRIARALVRTIFAAEAAGGARECCDAAAAYAKERQQFGRPIAMFQAVKHHCANMLVAAELATSATWDAARAASGDLDQFEMAAAVAATLAFKSYLDNAHLNIQVHGGIGFTWEHDAHLLMRRALALAATFTADDAGTQVIDSTRSGVVRAPGLSLPAEADALRAEVRAFAKETAALGKEAQRERLIETGYVMPHWPKPWGRDASAVEQLVIDEEFRAAGVNGPQYGITGWVILTLIQHGTDDQIKRWVLPALQQEVIWCQLFSEPEAGSDAAGVKTRATRVDGGWIINGQKVWTSGAHYSGLGLATVRTDPTAKKHEGITTVVIDMHGPGVEVRPLRQMTDNSDFNEVFFTDVFIPDDDVVGAVNHGWTVARATLGNERVSIGGGAGGGLGGVFDPVALLDAHPEHAAAVAPDVARHLAVNQTLRLMNLRRAARAVAGAEPGPEGNVTKLVLAEQGHSLASIGLRLLGPAVAYLEGEGGTAAYLTLMTRAMSIAGGTSEITRNQIGERLLGLPRDPLLK